jgi:hypothetical protein
MIPDLVYPDNKKIQQTLVFNKQVKRSVCDGDHVHVFE